MNRMAKIIEEAVAVVATPLRPPQPPAEEWNQPIHYGGGAFGSAMSDDEECECKKGKAMSDKKCMCGDKHTPDEG